MRTASFFTVRPGCIPPRRAHSGDAGLDLALQQDCQLEPGETAYIPSGVSFHCEPGLCVHVMTRSSTFKFGVIIIPTIVDQSYTGEASVIVTNISNHVVRLQRGDSIAQAVLLPYHEFVNEDKIPIGRQRQRGRFGSSGHALDEVSDD